MLHAISNAALILRLSFSFSDFGGWPEEEKERLVQFLTEENRLLIADKCSAQVDSVMSRLPTTMSNPLATASDSKKKGPCPAITPPRSYLHVVANGQASAVGGMAGEGDKKKKRDGKKTKADVAAKKPEAKKLSTAVMEKSNKIRQQWQEAAEKLGGPELRIIISKPEAEFCPMKTNGVSPFD